jgi:DNA mismatch endonuclease (patch repair protein)
MADRVSPKVRSKIMSSVGTRNTGPEMTLRRALHRLGFRYRTNHPDLPGRPDIVFPRLKKAIFVHGCFWHGHRCRKGRLPKSRLGYWGQKIEANRQRDRRSLRLLRKSGWSAFVVWQCGLKDLEMAIPEILRFLQNR